VLIILFVGCCSALTALQANPSDTFDLANKALAEGSTQDAVHLYETLVSNGYVSRDLYYNLGTAYATLGQVLPARLNLEKASYLAPADPAIHANLKQIRDEVGDFYTFPKYPLFGVIGWTRTFLFGNFWAWLTLLIFLGLGALVIGYRLFQKKRLKWPIALASGLLLLCLPFLLASMAYERFHGDMVLLTTGGGLCEIPEDEATIIEKLEAGAKLHIEEEYGEWLRVTSATGSQGWLTRSEIVKVI